MAALPADATTQEKAERGRKLERLFYAMFDEAGLSPRVSFRPRGEEIDGSFIFCGRTMLLEAKWTASSMPASAIYQFMGKVSGKLVGTIGLFVSMNGFSPDAIDALIAGKELNLILMDGADVHTVAKNNIGIVDGLREKLRAAAEYGAPFLSLDSVSSVQQAPAGVDRELILVEGRFDERIINVMTKAWGSRADKQSVVPVGGPLNFVSTAEAMLPSMDKIPKLVIIADGDDQPLRVSQRIQEDFRQRLPETAPRIIVADPTLESELGLFKPGEFASGRRKVLQLDDSLLLKQLKSSLGKLPTGSTNASKLLTELSIVVPN